MFARTTSLKSAFIVALAALSVAACESEVTGPDGDLVEGEITIDASNPAAFSYLTLADGGSAITVSDPLTSTDWLRDALFSDFLEA